MKRKIALFIAALILNISIMTAYYVPAYAMPVGPVADLMYYTFQRIIGHSWGTFQSTDEMTYNMNMSNLQDYWSHQVLGEPYYWEDEDTLLELFSKEGMLEFLDETIMDVHAHNAGDVVITTLNELNKRSYSATRTLASLTMEERLKTIKTSIAALSDNEYKSTFERSNEIIFNSTTAEAVPNLKLHYDIFEGVISGLLLRSTSELNSDWFKEVVDSAFSIYDLYKGTFVFEDVSVPVYQIDKLEYSVDNGNAVGILELSESCYVMPFFNKSVPQYAVCICSDKEFNVTWNMGTYASSYSNSGFYYAENGLYSPDSLPIDFYTGDGNAISRLKNAFYDFYKTELCGKNLALENGESISVVAPGLNLALDAFWNKDLTVDDVNNLAADLSAAEAVAGTDTALKTLTDVVAGITVTLPDAIVDGTNDVVTAVDGLGEAILTLPKAIWKEFAGTLEDIQSKVGTQTQTKPWEGDLNEDSPDIIPIFNALIILLQIIIALLKIFIHCLQFIIKIFAIQPSSAMLPEEMVMGLEYINTIQVPGLGMSIYSFMMGLVYITIVFFAIRILRVNVDRIKIPKKLNGGM